MIPTLVAIADAGGERSNDDIRAAVALRLRLSEEQMAMPHGTKGRRTELEYRIAWARTKLGKKGLLDTAGPRRWRLALKGWSELGREGLYASVGSR